MTDEEIRDDLLERLALAIHLRLTETGSGHEVWECKGLAHELLPVVVGNMRRYAAMHLRDAADEIRARFGWAGGYGKQLRGRADELDPPVLARRGKATRGTGL